jgi:hypothetical protein
MAVPFGGSGHREGFVVRFNPDTPDEWVGNFQPGYGGWEGVLVHPDGKHAIVVSGGEGYVVDPRTRELAHVFFNSIQYAIELPYLQAVILSDGIRFEAIRGDGIWWTSPRISWDEIRAIKIEGTILRGEASSPVGDSNAWVPFTLDLLTGRCEDGVYDRDMRRAIPVRRPSVDWS